ncbi:hypothetical protein ANO11243_017230 [Dothideomycetidae sp. 11243]|nr:hypothetical protein ANO11243_017230 [fungal sp. No.11243]
MNAYHLHSREKAAPSSAADVHASSEIDSSIPTPAEAVRGEDSHPDEMDAGKGTSGGVLGKIGDKIGSILGKGDDN